MFPCFPLNDSAYRRRINPKSFGYVFLLHAIGEKLSNFNNLRRNKAGRVNGITFDLISMIHSAFGNHVERVIEHCSKPKMGRVDAGRIVAFVQNFHALRNRAVGKLISETMGECRRRSRAKLTITMFIDAGTPYPAFIGASYFDLAPEPIDYGQTPMTSNKMWLPTRILGLPKLLPTTAFTKFRGIIEGHRKFTFLMSNPGALVRRRQVFSLASTRPIVACLGGIIQ
jgi:hypothetical protein